MLPHTSLLHNGVTTLPIHMQNCDIDDWNDRFCESHSTIYITLYKDLQITYAATHSIFSLLKKRSMDITLGHIAISIIFCLIVQPY